MINSLYVIPRAGGHRTCAHRSAHIFAGIFRDYMIGIKTKNRWMEKFVLLVAGNFLSFWNVGAY